VGLLLLSCLVRSVHAESELWPCASLVLLKFVHLGECSLDADGGQRLQEREEFLSLDMRRGVMSAIDLEKRPACLVTRRVERVEFEAVA